MPIEQDSSLTKPAEADPVEAKNIVSDPIASSLCPYSIVTADVSGNQKTLEAKIAALRLQIDDTRAKLQHDAAKLKWVMFAAIINIGRIEQFGIYRASNALGYPTASLLESYQSLLTGPTDHLTQASRCQSDYAKSHQTPA